jgi:cytoskeletal protein CcmA (bactofilin family)
MRFGREIMSQNRWLLVALLGAVISANASSNERAIPEMQLAPTGEDTYVFGEHVVVRDAIDGDLVAAGETIRVAGDVAEDVIAAAASVEISGSVADDVRLAGAEVELLGPVSGHAVLAGADVRVGKDASIGDWLWVSGSRIRLDGEIGGELRAAGSEVELNGSVAGDVDIAGGRLRLGDNAVIAGDLTWRSGVPIEISEKAVVRGQITEAGIPEAFADERDEWSLWGLLIYAGSLLLTAGVLRSLFPLQVVGCESRVREQPLQCFIVGLAVFATTPLVLILLSATAVGWLLAVLGGLFFLLALASAGVVGMNALAAIGLFWFRRDPANPQIRDVWFVLILVSLLVTFVWPVLFLLAVFGLGAMAMGFYGRWAQMRSG